MGFGNETFRSAAASPAPCMAGEEAGSSSKPPAELDFLSPSFSAEQALVCSPSRLQLPCPEVQPCDNLEHYSSIVHGSSRRLSPASLSRAGHPEEEEEEREEEKKEERVSGAVERRVRSVLSFMESECAI